MSWRDEFFSYRGYNCRIEHGYVGNKIQALHYVVDRNGKEIFANITPHDSSPETLRLWIDAGLPVGYESQQFIVREDLQRVICERA